MLCSLLGTTHWDRYLPTGVAPENINENNQGPRKHEERLHELKLKLEENALSFHPPMEHKEGTSLKCDRANSV